MVGFLPTGRGLASGLCLWLATVLVWGFGSLSAAAQTSLGTYRATWLGLPVGTVFISHSLGPLGSLGSEDDAAARAYGFSITLQSGGILGSSRFTTTFTGRGDLNQQQLLPARGNFSDVRRGELRSETIDFAGGLPAFSSVPRYLVPAEFQFNLELARGALDPSSGLLMLLHMASQGQCERSFRVYDGFSLYEARLEDQGLKRVRNDLFDGQAPTCRLRLTPLAGKAAVFDTTELPEMEVSVANLRPGMPGMPALPVAGALYINGNRAGLRLTHFEVQ